jgi:hypothetical protein
MTCEYIETTLVISTGVHLREFLAFTSPTPHAYIISPSTKLLSRNGPNYVISLPLQEAAWKAAA